MLHQPVKPEITPEARMTVRGQNMAEGGRSA